MKLIKTRKLQIVYYLGLTIIFSLGLTFAAHAEPLSYLGKLLKKEDVSDSACEDAACVALKLTYENGILYVRRDGMGVVPSKNGLDRGYSIEETREFVK